jgi:hypothetical protein
MSPAAVPRIRVLCEDPPGAMARFRISDEHPLRAWLVLAIAAALGVTFASSPLPRITPDSTNYLTGAEKIADAGRFESCDGPITLFAPGYAAAMAPLVRLGLDAPDAARLVNLLATVLLVLGAGALSRGAGLSARGSIVVALAVAASYVVLRNGALVWSEPLFCAILVWLLVAAVNDGRGLPVRFSARLALVVSLTWMLLLTRHSGVFVLPAVLLAGWFGSTHLSRRSIRVGLLALGLVAAPALWWLRNAHIDGDPFGRRSGSRYSEWEVLWQLPDALSSLALPAELPLALRLAVLVPFVAATVLAWRRSAGLPRVRLPVIVLWMAVAGYAVGVTIAAMRTVVDPLDTRLLSPVFVLAVVLAALGVGTLRLADRTRLERGLVICVVGLVTAMALLAPGVVWRGYTAARTLEGIPDDVSCAEWPAVYSASEAIRLAIDGR